MQREPEIVFHNTHRDEAVEADILRRIERLERFFEVEKGQPIVWRCHDCHEGCVVPGEYVNSHGELVHLDPDSLPDGVRVLAF